MKTISISIDVEWAHKDVINDLLQLLDERDIKATLFCTHEGIVSHQHERAIHPNFRPDGDAIKHIKKELGSRFETCPSPEIYRRVIEYTQQFAPEAKGTRSHCLFSDFDLIIQYEECGIEYDSSYFLPLNTGLRPLMKERNIVELPFYYMDHMDIQLQTTKFDVKNLKLDEPGLKIFGLHPNMVYINAQTEKHYIESKVAYHNPKELINYRRDGWGIRTLFIALLDYIKDNNLETKTLGEINDEFRASLIHDLPTKEHDLTPETINS